MIIVSMDLVYAKKIDVMFEFPLQLVPLNKTVLINTTIQNNKLTPTDLRNSKILRKC